MSRRLKNALALQELGYAILPIHGWVDGACTCGNAKCKSPGKHPWTRNGVHDATRSRLKTKRWWGEHPKANIGLPTGPDADLIVFDIDPRKGGDQTLAELLKRIGPLPNTARVETGGDGEHLYFRHPKFPLKSDNKGKLLGSGIDVLSAGAYVIAPPSSHASGGVYKHDKERNLLSGTKVLPLPSKWLRHLRRNAKKKLKPELGASSPKDDAIIDGERNATLASKGGNLVRMQLTDEAVLQSLFFINSNSCVPPLPEEDVRKIAESVLRYRETDVTIQDRPEYVVAGTLLAEFFEGGEHLSYVPEHGFLAYDGRKWCLIDVAQLQKLALKIIEARASAGGKVRTLLSDTMHLLQIKQVAERDVFFGDAHQKPVINCLNGELWIGDDGKPVLRPHSPTSCLTHCLSVTYDPHAKSKRYDRALLEIFAECEDAADMARHLNELFGYIIQTKRDVPLICLFLGGGSNGKSELWQTLAELIGRDFIASGSIDKLDGHQFGFGFLRGKLVFVDDDMNTGVKLPDGALKKLSEGKILTGELKYENAFTFVNRAVPILLANTEPTTSDLSHGLRRRIQVVPFKHQFTEGVDLDSSVWEHIRQNELSGILNRSLKALERFRARGSKWKLPSDVVLAGQEWFRIANPLKGFLDERCEIAEKKEKILISDLFVAYSRWASDNGLTYRLQRNTMIKQLKQLGYNIGNSKKGSCVVGVILKPDG